MDRPLCLHCKRNLAAKSKRRGLCSGCYDDLEIREKYPKNVRPPKEPTEEQIEAIIAKQLERLPRWWERESKRISPFRGGFVPRFTAPVRSTERRST